MDSFGMSPLFKSFPTVSHRIGLFEHDRDPQMMTCKHNLYELEVDSISSMQDRYSLGKLGTYSVLVP